LFAFPETTSLAFWIAPALMGLGVWPHLTEHHAHEQLHEVHEHAHEYPFLSNGHYRAARCCLVANVRYGAGKSKTAKTAVSHLESAALVAKRPFKERDMNPRGSESGHWTMAAIGKNHSMHPRGRD
jgi:hypothetical protein